MAARWSSASPISRQNAATPQRNPLAISGGRIRLRGSGRVVTGARRPPALTGHRPSAALTGHRTPAAGPRGSDQPMGVKSVLPTNSGRGLVAEYGSTHVFSTEL